MDIFAKILETFSGYLYFISVSEKSYKGMFKGGVVLFTFSLILLNIMGTVIYPIEKEARLSHYKVEKIEGAIIEDILEHSCKVSSNSYVDCKMSQDKFGIMDVSYSFIEAMLKFSFSFAIILLLFSAISFFATTSRQYIDSQ